MAYQRDGLSQILMIFPMAYMGKQKHEKNIEIRYRKSLLKLKLRNYRRLSLNERLVPVS